MKILLPIDGTPAALHAVRHALGWRTAGLAVDFVLANVQEPPSLYEVVVAHDAEVLSQVRRDAGADLLAGPRRCSRRPGRPGRARSPAATPAT